LRREEKTGERKKGKRKRGAGLVGSGGSSVWLLVICIIWDFKSVTKKGPITFQGQGSIPFWKNNCAYSHKPSWQPLITTEGD